MEVVKFKYPVFFADNYGYRVAVDNHNVPYVNLSHRAYYYILSFLVLEKKVFPPSF